MTDHSNDVTPDPFGRAMLRRVRPRIGATVHGPARHPLGAVGRSAIGFGRSIASSTTSRPTVTANTLVTRSLRPPPNAWWWRSAPDEPDDLPATRRPAAWTTIARRPAEPEAPAAAEVAAPPPRARQPVGKLEALRQLLEGEGLIEPSDGSSTASDDDPSIERVTGTAAARTAPRRASGPTGAMPIGDRRATIAGTTTAPGQLARRSQAETATPKTDRVRTAPSVSRRLDPGSTGSTRPASRRSQRPSGDADLGQFRRLLESRGLIDELDPDDSDTPATDGGRPRGRADSGGAASMPGRLPRSSDRPAAADITGDQQRGSESVRRRTPSRPDTGRAGDSPQPPRDQRTSDLAAPTSDPGDRGGGRSPSASEHGVTQVVGARPAPLDTHLATLGRRVGIMHTQSRHRRPASTLTLGRSDTRPPVTVIGGDRARSVASVSPAISSIVPPAQTIGRRQLGDTQAYVANSTTDVQRRPDSNGTPDEPTTDTRHSPTAPDPTIDANPTTHVQRRPDSNGTPDEPTTDTRHSPTAPDPTIDANPTTHVQRRPDSNGAPDEPGPTRSPRRSTVDRATPVGATRSRRPAISTSPMPRPGSFVARVMRHTDADAVTPSRGRPLSALMRAVSAQRSDRLPSSPATARLERTRSTSPAYVEPVDEAGRPLAAPSSESASPRTSATADSSADPTTDPRTSSPSLGDRFLAELSQGAGLPATPLATRFEPIALAVAGSKRAARVSADATSRRALRSVGRRAATVNDVIHLDRDPAGTPDVDAVIAHELTHVAHPSPHPRFLDDEHRGPEERLAEHVADVIRRSPPVRAGAVPASERSGAARTGAQVVQRAPAPTSAPSGAISAASVAEAISASTQASPTTPTVLHRRHDTASASPPSISASSDGDTVQRFSSPAPALGASSSTESVPSGAASMSVHDFEHMLEGSLDFLMQRLEDRMLMEFDRRGGRHWRRS